MSDQQNNHEKNTESIDSNTEGAGGSGGNGGSGGGSVARGRSLKKRDLRSKCCK